MTLQAHWPASASLPQPTTMRGLGLPTHALHSQALPAWPLHHAGTHTCRPFSAAWARAALPGLPASASSAWASLSAPAGLAGAAGLGTEGPGASAASRRQKGKGGTCSMPPTTCSSRPTADWAEAIGAAARQLLRGIMTYGQHGRWHAVACLCGPQAIYGYLLWLIVTSVGHDSASHQHGVPWSAHACHEPAHAC